MLRAVTTAVTLAIFLLYSQSLLVMWCLYFVEKHDIVLYFCPEDIGSSNPFAGARFVHELSDAQHGAATGAFMLLKLVERASVFLHFSQTVWHAVAITTVTCRRLDHPSLLDGYRHPPFIPPRNR